jgi:hypothetical protein
MKNILTFILMSFLGITALGQTSTNGVFTIEGKTTEVANNIYTVNKPAVVLFSDGLISKVETNSELQVNSFFQDVENTSNNPEKAKFGQSTLALTLSEGSAYFVYPEADTNSSVVVSTPFADVELHKGSFYFVVSSNNVLCLVINGSINAYGEKKDQKKVEAGNALVVIPTTQGILDTKFSLSTQFIYPATLERYKTTIKDLSKFSDSVLFIRINGKTVGVSL